MTFPTQFQTVKDMSLHNGLDSFHLSMVKIQC